MNEKTYRNTYSIANSKLHTVKQWTTNKFQK